MKAVMDVVCKSEHSALFVLCAVYNDSLIEMKFLLSLFSDTQPFHITFNSNC